MANRVVTSGDIPLYSSWITQEGLPPMQVGDIILDTLTNSAPANGIFYNNSVSWGGITLSEVRQGPTIWVDASLSGTLSFLKLGGNGLPVLDTTRANPCVVRPLNGQVKLIRNSSETANRCLELEDIAHQVIDGELNSYPGLRDDWGIYRSGTFGFWVTDAERSKTARMVAVTGDNTKSVIFRGIEVNHGFSAFRCMRTNENQVVDYFLLERCLAAFAVEGEGTYLGMTVDNLANPIFNEFILRDFISAFRAAEGVQINNMAANAGKGYVENFVIYCSATRGRDAFQDNQDTGMQFEVQDGNIEVRNFIIHGWGSIGFHLFSSDKTARGFFSGNDILKIKNFVMDAGRQMFIRTHGSMEFGPEVEFRDGYFLDINDTISETGDPVYDYLVESATQDSNRQHYVSMKYKPIKTNFFANVGPSNSFDKTFSVNLVSDNSLPSIEYINSGFNDVDPERIEIWSATGLQISGAAMSWNLGDYAINAPINGEYAFYKCIVAHTSGAGDTNRPDLDPTNWVKITWDLSGVRSDSVGHSAGDTQSELPPLDLRLKEDTTYANLNMGLLCTPQNPNQTRYILQWTEDLTGSPDMTKIKTTTSIRSNIVDISKFNYLTSGRHVRTGIVLPNDDILYSNWIQIP